MSIENMKGQLNLIERLIRKNEERIQAQEVTVILPSYPRRIRKRLFLADLACYWENQIARADSLPPLTVSNVFL